MFGAQTTTRSPGVKRVRRANARRSLSASRLQAVIDGQVIALWAAFASRCQWTRVYHLWRPNLPVEADNQVVELAVAGGAEVIVTHNTRDFERAELHFPGMRVLRPGDLITED